MTRNPARTIALAAVLTAALTGQALAHAHLVSETPKAGTTVTASPGELDLRFSEGIEPSFTGVTVTGPGKVTLGKATLGAGGDTTLVVPIENALEAGTYSVKWHALSVDGHKSKGSYSFTIKP